MTFYLTNPGHDIFIPDGSDPGKALTRTTHMAVGAHQDDLEIMAYDGALKCFGQSDLWFAGVVVTNGAGSPRSGIYEQYTDAEMQNIRRIEQRKAAFVGEYGACVQLGHTSAAVKDPNNGDVVKDLAALLKAARPKIVYTHNLADKHDTHVGTALKLIAAVRTLPCGERPEKLYGCEVWRGLDWLCDGDKTVFDVSGRANIAAALVGVHDSQVAGGKRYDLATAGRRVANATYHASHAVDSAEAAIFAIDMTPLIKDDSLDPRAFTLALITRFAEDAGARLEGLLNGK